MLDTRLPRPADARVFTARRRIRLSDRAPTGRTRLDAVARFLQDAAIDDVQETGWGTPAHLWFVRSIQVDVVVPLLGDRALELATWCSGVGAIAAGRRWSVVGDAGGHVEVDSVWIHLDPEQRPARIGDFGPYAAAAEGRSITTRCDLPDPPTTSEWAPWPLRTTDLDAHGHVNNAVHWQAVEDRLERTGFDLSSAHRVCIDYRDPIELDDELVIAGFDGDSDGQHIALGAAGRIRAVASVGPLPPPAPAQPD